MFKKDWITSSVLITTPHSIINTLERTYVFSKEIDKHALSIAIIESKEVQFPSIFFVDASLYIH